tara:strand:- start:526 stop:1197 length:672 start_codon:yes stop_codon:yes gene_type:complete
MANMNIPANLKLVKKGEIDSAIKKDITRRVKKSYQLVETKLGRIVQDMVDRQLMASSTMQSIMNGKLRSDFGLTTTMASEAVKQIMDHIVSNIKVSFTATSRSAAVLSLELLPMGIDQLTAIPAGSYMSTGKLGGGEVSWLTWLLTRGTQVVLGDFYVFENPKGRSRTGESIMQRVGKTGQEGFRVDPGFSGTEEDNFVIRALEPVLDKIRDVVFSTVAEGLK